MLPLEHVPFHPNGALFVPAWLGPEDHPWIDALLDELRRFEGRRTREWQCRAREPLRAETSERRRLLAVATLDRLCERSRPTPDARPAALREALFEAAQRGREQGMQREQILRTVSEQLGLTPEVLMERLYADLPLERPLSLPAPLPDAPDLVRHTNQHIARSLLRAASQIDLRLSSRSRPLIRQILLHRLLATVRPDKGGVLIEVSGPLSLFRHTTLYGRALASLVPMLRGVDSFELLARCAVGGRPMTVRMGSGDPIFPPGPAPRPYDSALEERFARDFLKAAPDWDLVREPEPVAVADTWIFPDFALVHRRDRRRWLLEIVGFWTPAYLSNKLDRLRRAGRRDLIVAVDEKLGCGTESLPNVPHLIRFRRRVDPAAILAILNTPAPVQEQRRLERRLIQPTDLFLDYAGRRPSTDPVHARLSTLRPDDPVVLRHEAGRLMIVNHAGQTLAVLSSAASARWTPLLGRVRGAHVLAVRERTRAEGTVLI